jgi:manganese-dependent inorganic pyrophosphatase
MQTIVIGHKNPDMDAIVSALAYAEFKRACGWPDVIAARAGSLNERINFALGKFNQEAPVFMGNLAPRVEDVMERQVIRTREDAPIYDALNHIGENRFRGLPVVDAEERCLGLISSFKIGRYLFPPPDARTQAREVKASLADICETFSGRAVAGELSTDVRDYILMVASMNPETFAERVHQMADPAQTVLFVGDRSDIVELAIGLGVHAIVLTSAIHPSAEMLEAARRHDAVLIESPYDTATSVLLSRSAIQARFLLDEKFTKLAPDTLLEEARRELANSNAFAFPVVESKGTLVGILSKSDFIRPVPRQLILVDHNEMSQAVTGAEELPIVEIIDHHRISTITTDAPILFLNRPVGSTSTIVADSFRESPHPLPPALAGLLMCGLISDTLNLTSPTTTETDHRIMNYLREITGLNPTELAGEIFSVGSPLLTMTAEAAISADRKLYEVRGKKFTVAQIEELSFSQFPKKEDLLQAALRAHREAENLYFAALLVTDINTQNSILLVQGSRSFRRLIDYPERNEYCWQLDGVVSRKKQLLPYLSGLVQRLA